MNFIGNKIKKSDVYNIVDGLLIKKVGAESSLVKKTIKMVIAYDGTAYAGFQRQKNAETVQGILENVFRNVFGEQDLVLIGAGRTDAGVHAKGQVVSVKTSGSIYIDKIVLACNKILPKDITVKSAVLVDEKFHALRSSKGKRYFYNIFNNFAADPFYNRYAWHIRKPLLLKEMEKAAVFLVGIHDFSAFRSSGSNASDSVREIYEVFFKKNNDLIKFYISGNGFLYHMVRNIVGALVAVGMGKIKFDDFEKILYSCDRTKFGYTAPPQGLFLDEVFYDI